MQLLDAACGDEVEMERYSKQRYPTTHQFSSPTMHQNHTVLGPSGAVEDLTILELLIRFVGLEVWRS